MGISVVTVLGVDVDELVAIDMHVHAEISADGHPSMPEHLMAGSARYFKLDGDRQPGLPQIAAYYRQRRMAAVVFTPPPLLVQYANTLLRDKVLFGSDFPLLTPDRWLADFDALDIKPAVRPLILKQNAARLLGLAP